MKKSLFVILAIFGALIATLSCKKEKDLTSGTEEPPIVKVSGVSVDKTTIGLMVGEKVKLVATVTPEDATNKNVSYKSDDNNIATVTQDGEISAVGEGSIIVWVTTEDGQFRAGCKVYVSNTAHLVKEIELNETELTLAVGETFQLTAAIKPSYANNKNVVWSSKNEQVATVNETGLVTAIAVGGTRIFASSEDGGAVSVCNLMVSNPGVNEIRKFEFSPNYGIIGVGEKLNLKPYLWKVYSSFFNVRPEFPSQFTFNSDDPEVATVDNDFNIIGNKAGTALITVTMNRFKNPEIGSFTIEVEDTFLGSVKDVYKIKDKGLVLESTILSGKLYPNDEIKLIQRSDNGKNYNMTVGQLSLYGKVLEYAGKGDEPGILLAGTEQMSTSDIERGAVITSPETKRVIVTRKVVGTLHITGKTAPITPGHKLQFFDGTIDVGAELSEIFKEEEIKPDKIYHLVTFKIAAPYKLACRYGQVFKLREGGREVGTFIVSDADPMEVAF